MIPTASGAHHDGSERYVSNPTPELGDTVTVHLRVPQADRVGEVHLRTVRDAEPERLAASLDRETEHEQWWRVELPIHNPLTSYRWHLRRGADTWWVNAAGTHHHELSDNGDFRISALHRPPSWVTETVWYQVFPDRFSRRPDGRFEAPLPGWAHERHWSDPIRTDFPEAMQDLWGGSLNGVVHRLDHLEALGVNGIYTCPTWPARSNHRYDATSFDETDPLLGGDEAMRLLAAEAARRGMRVMGDLTTNHSGDGHHWFQTALTDPASPERDFYLWEGDDYVKWLGVDTLPKFDHRSDELARRLYDGPDSIGGRMVADADRPGGMGLAAIRVDVANMTGRYGPFDLNRRVAAGLRATMAGVRPDAWLLGEHNHDASADLDGGGWHGTMNYAGFSRPVWSWLGRTDRPVPSFGDPGPMARRSGSQMLAAARAHLSQMPYTVALHSMVLLGSHDSARWAYSAGADDMNLVGFAMACGWPGAPSIFYGDEIGLGEDADWDVTARQPFPWHDPDSWNRRLLDGYRELVALRRSNPALARGGMRWLSVGDDHLVWLRESLDQTVLVHVARCAHESIDVDLAAVGHASFTPLGGASVAEGPGLQLDAEGPTWRMVELR